MIQLPLPCIDSNLLLDSIIKNKKKRSKTILIPHISKVKERYNYYEQNFNSLHQITPLYDTWDLAKDELISCYGSNAAFSIAKNKLMATMPTPIQSKCPYCMLNRPNTLDHYFDKSSYPEYSVFIPNLVCCCSECNSQKGVQFSILMQNEYSCIFITIKYQSTNFFLYALKTQLLILFLKLTYFLDLRRKRNWHVSLPIIFTN